MKHQIIMAALLGLGLIQTAPGATIGYWRFENSGNLGADSGGGARGLSSTNGPVAEDITDAGPGQYFSKTIPLTGSTNTLGVRLHGTNHFFRADEAAFGVSNQITIEAYFTISNVTLNTTHPIAAQYSDTVTPLTHQKSWILAVRQDTGNPIRLRFIAAQKADGTVQAAFNVPAWALELNHDYYAAVVFSNGTASCYLSDLWANPPVLNTFVTNNLVCSNIANSTGDFRIGAFQTDTTAYTRFSGLVDEVRWSDTALPVAGLLYSYSYSPGPPPPMLSATPEPGGCRLKFSGERGALVQLQNSSDLIHWTNGTALLNDSGTIEWLQPSLGPKQFYRAQVLTGPLAELAAVTQQVPQFSVVGLPAAGSVVLSPSQSLRCDDLRGVVLDNNPPMLGTPAPAYATNMANDCLPGQEPYIATNVAPFRFRYFTNEFNYGGWHTLDMADYASTHGFNILYPYVRPTNNYTHLPAGTTWLTWGGFDWETWMPSNGIPAGRYDLLVATNVLPQLATSGFFAYNSRYQSRMLDIEHSWLGPANLRLQPWYPTNGTPQEQAAFEQSYYQGYGLTYTGPVDTAHAAGWNNVSVYGWQPFDRVWVGLDTVNPDPATDFPWNAFGQGIYQSVDILNPSVYCFYWSQQNAAYTLANIDLNFRFVNSMAVRKPMRPYYWTLLHGGGGGWRWWREQALPNEDARAMTGLAFFTGVDGIVNWNWSYTGSHIIAAPVVTNTDHVLKESFTLTADGASSPTVFNRYDAIHVGTVTNGVAAFQLIEKGNAAGNYGVATNKPVYHLADTDLRSHIRPLAEPVAGVIEGLALVKPFEYLLRHGEVKVDVSAQTQYAGTLPIVRRVKLGSYHVVGTFDPAWSSQPAARSIVLTNFDGYTGLTVTLPADRELRVFVLRDVSPQ